MEWKEIAKFASGMAAWESIAHGYLWLSKTQMTVFGFVLTEKLNMLQSVFSAVISGLFAYYAWFREE
ncbi:MAG: hypothetical protein GOV01_03540 [Candidatus Altiarchaeota archaeon]|nr:hypothetical protein [Candidatus Altiarchaeota archaeon]